MATLVVDNASVDPDITVCCAGVVQLDVKDSCEIIACTVQLRIEGHCSGGILEPKDPGDNYDDI